MSPQNRKLPLLKKINSDLEGALKICAICPRKCGVDRARGELGWCRAGLRPKIYSYSPHHGEEPPLSGTRGSGTIFFSGCNMKCAYCQNYYFSQLDKGMEVTIDKLAAMMLGLQKKGCHNINLVTPTHYAVQILQALEIAIAKGLDIPIVYNTSGYELPEMIKRLRGIIDIYLPDMRYSDDRAACRYSEAVKYVEYNRNSVKEMQAQVGDLVLDDEGIAKKGLIIRLLALPEGLSGTIESLKFIKDSISKNARLSIMSQYYPTFKAYDYKEISRGVTIDEYEFIVDEARQLRLNKGWVQEAPGGFDPRFLGTSINPNI
ncbi:MAG: radical SAM protein [Candidatus Omnitrophota bacterium]